LRYLNHCLNSIVILGRLCKYIFMLISLNFCCSLYRLKLYLVTEFDELSVKLK
jgi:hypothetical protein